MQFGHYEGCYDPDCDGCDPGMWDRDKLIQSLSTAESNVKFYKKLLKRK